MLARRVVASPQEFIAFRATEFDRHEFSPWDGKGV
jgi:hypothetical protein